MPDLNLPALHTSDAGLYLNAVMFLPHEPEKHQLFVAAARAHTLRRLLLQKLASNALRANELGHPEAVEVLIEAATGPTFQDVFGPGHRPIMTWFYPRPLMAAFIFLYALSSAEAGDERAGLEQARRVIGTAAGAQASVQGRSRSYLVDCWRDFAPAAHLWAAKTLFPSLYAGANTGAGLARFLAYAEALRHRGEQHRSPHSSSRLLDPEATWKVSDRFILPEISIGPLPAPARYDEILRGAFAADNMSTKVWT